MSVLVVDFVVTVLAPLNFDDFEYLISYPVTFLALRLTVTFALLLSAFTEIEGFVLRSAIVFETVFEYAP